MRAIKLNAENFSIDVVEWETLQDLQNHVGGPIKQIYLDWLEKNEIALLVDGDGYLKNHPYGVSIPNTTVYFAGNGLIVGDTGARYTDTNFNEALIENYLSLFNFEKDPHA